MPKSAKTHRLRIGSLAFAVLALVTSIARADDVSASASISDPSAEVGQSVEYRIEVVDGSRGSQPSAPEVDGLSITAAGSSSSRQLSFNFGGGSGNHDTTTTTYLFNVEPSRAGRFVIPGQDLHIGGSTVHVNPVTFTVASDAAGAQGGQRNYFGQLELGNKTLYVGQASSVEFRALFAPNVGANLQPDLQLGGGGFTTGKFSDPRQGAMEFEDAQYRAMTYRTLLSAAKTGPISIGPAGITAVVQVPRPRSRRTPNFNNPFESDPFFRDPWGAFNTTVAKQVKITAPAQTIEVKPLPKGAPADFTGAIGQFTLEAQADSQRVKAGDPVTVHLRLSGSGNFDRIGAPKLKSEDGLQVYPATSKFKSDDDIGLSGTKTFDQVVTPQSGRASLPAYHFSYFDPDTGKYESLDTPPIAVAVEGNAAVPAPTPESSVSTAAAPTPTPKPVAARDILYLRTDEGRLTDASAFAPIWRRPIFWCAQIIPLAGLLILLAARLFRGRGVDESQQRRETWQRTVRDPRTGRRDFYDAAARLAETDGRSNDPTFELVFRRRDELAYSGAAIAQEPVPAEERREVLGALEKH